MEKCNTKKFKKNNLVSTGSQKLYSDFTVYVYMVAHDTHHTSHIHYWFQAFPLRGTKLCTPLYKLPVSGVCKRQVTEWFTTVSVLNHLQARCLLRGPKRHTSLGPIPPSGGVTADGPTAGKLWITHRAVPVSCPVIQISLTRLRSICFAKYLKDADVKQAVTSCIYLIWIFSKLVGKNAYIIKCDVYRLWFTNFWYEIVCCHVLFEVAFYISRRKLTVFV
jgi:hypothetical protein